MILEEPAQDAPDEAASHDVDVPIVVDVDGAVAELLEGAGKIFEEEHLGVALDHVELAMFKREPNMRPKLKARKLMNLHVLLLRIAGDRAQHALIGARRSDALKARKAGIVPAGRPKRFGRDGVKSSLEFVQETNAGLLISFQGVLPVLVKRLRVLYHKLYRCHLT